MAPPVDSTLVLHIQDTCRKPLRKHGNCTQKGLRPGIKPASCSSVPITFELLTLHLIPAFGAHVSVFNNENSDLHVRCKINVNVYFLSFLFFFS